QVQRVHRSAISTDIALGISGSLVSHPLGEAEYTLCARGVGYGAWGVGRTKRKKRTHETPLLPRPKPLASLALRARFRHRALLTLLEGFSSWASATAGYSTSMRSRVNAFAATPPSSC